MIEVFNVFNKKTALRKLIAGVACISLALPLTAVNASDDSWPQGPVSFVMHTQAGGSADVFIRTLAESLEPQIGQPIVVINSPGGAGATQMSRLKSANPDGLTLGINTLSHFTGMLTNLNGVFALDDFSWIASTQEDVHIVFANQTSEIDSIDTLINKAKEGSGQVSVGGFGPQGSTQNIAMSMLENATNVEFEWIAYNGTPDIVAAVMGGHVDVGVSNLSALKTFFDAERIQGLGVVADERLASLPNVPTFSEQGVDVDASWIQVRGVFGPEGIPVATQHQIADAFHKAMQTEHYQTYARNAGISDSWMGPEEYTEFASRISEVARAELGR
ncbi:MAG: Bug family tripartite tricarboxylate transporter substrate binding protein [Halomonas sp.]|uniref:Bug family tripartite tricarboxylate transporter substrate binding protein n=1 Tax=Halomonas sp. TaxID=1486246 RepID=UPI003F913B13